MDLRVIGLGSIDLTDVDQDRNQWRALVNTVMNIWVPYNLGKFLTGGFSRATELHGVS
jgi:hypothetical protein